MANLRIVGYTDSVNECDCCGKTELKGTYVMANDQDDEFYYGTTCGAKAASMSQSEFKDAFSKLTKEKKNKALIECYINPLKIELEEKVAAFGNSEARFIQNSIKHIESYYEGLILRNFKKYKIVL